MCRGLLLNLDDVQGLFNKTKLDMALMAAEMYQQLGESCSGGTSEDGTSRLNVPSKTEGKGIEDEVLIGALDGMLISELLGTCHKPEVEVGDEFDWFFNEETEPSLAFTEIREIHAQLQSNEQLAATSTGDKKLIQQRDSEDEVKSTLRLLAALALGVSRNDEAVCHISLAAALQFARVEDISVEKVLFQDVIGPCQDQSTCVPGICFPIVEASNPLLNIDAVGIGVPTILRCLLVESGLKNNESTDQSHILSLQEFASSQTEACGLCIFFGGRVSTCIVEQFRDYGVCLFCDIPVTTIRRIGSQIGAIPLPSLCYANPLKSRIPEAKVTILERGWHPDLDTAECTDCPSTYFGVIQQLEPDTLRSVEHFGNNWRNSIGAKSQTAGEGNSFVTVVLCSPSFTQLQEIKSKVQRVIKKISEALRTKQCLPGGGALELSCAAVLMHKAEDLSSVDTEDYTPAEALKIFAEALLDLIRIILHNKGYSAIDVENLIATGMQCLKHQQSSGDSLSREWNLMSKFPVEYYAKSQDEDVDTLIFVDDHQSRELGFQIAGNLAEQALMTGFFLS